MKHILSILLIGIFSLFIVGCEDWLTLRPESDIVLEDFWNNESEVSQVLASCYRSLTEGDVVERFLIWGEARSDNIVLGRGGNEHDLQRLLDGDLSLNNGYAGWGGFYRTINYCNTFLQYAPEVIEKDENFTEVIYNSYKAEVLAIRSLAYFYLVRTFKDIPWIEEASIDDNQEYRVSQSTEEEVLENIIRDLQFAERYSRDKFESDRLTKGRFTRTGIRALMADVYMWMEDYDNAIKYSDLVIGNSELELAPTKTFLSEVFSNGNSTESIFELQFQRDITPNGAVNNFLGIYSEPMGLFAFPYVLAHGDNTMRIFDRKVGSTQESKEDIRSYTFFRNMSVDRFHAFKYAGAMVSEQGDGRITYVYSSSESNWIVYRLADIILLKAEALVQQERLEEAMECVNMTYVRSNPGVQNVVEELLLENYPGKGDMEDLVLRERQRELVFEGKRWFDLMRVARREGSPVPLANHVAKKYSGSTSGGQNLKLSVMDALYMPIHTNEMKNNSKLKQNPFYELDNEITHKK